MKSIQKIFFTAIIAFNFQSVSAQTDSMPMDGEMHQGHDMSQMPMNDDMPQGQNMENMSNDNAPMMDHSQHMPMMQDSNSMQHDMGSMSGMNHGSMQGGSAPADARDPHAYSGGYTLDSGKYALPGPRMLRLGDEHSFASLLVDRLELVNSSDDKFGVYDMQAWYGRDYNRIMFKSEGHYNNDELEEASHELLWSHAITAFWNSELGVRYDQSEETNRTWLAVGVQGLAPYWFEMDITAYLGEEGRTSIGLEAEYELLLTQKLILQPRIETALYGKKDEENGIGAGLTEFSAGIRLRYEILRELGPYVGIEWAGKFGETADYAEAAGHETSETRAVAGIRFWF